MTSVLSSIQQHLTEGSYSQLKSEDLIVSEYQVIKEVLSKIPMMEPEIAMTINQFIYGERTIKYANGDSIKQIFKVKNDQKHGEFKEYFRNSQLRIKTNYSYDKLHGLYLEYFSNGRLKIKTIYSNDKLDGPYLEYYSTGILKIKTKHKKGKICDVYGFWNENGSFNDMESKIHIPCCIQ